MQVLIVDGANVVGSRPDGWWRDRARAARRLQEQLSTAVLPHDEVVLVLEGAARQGNPAGQDGRLRTVHAPGSGDDAIVETVVHIECGTCKTWHHATCFEENGGCAVFGCKEKRGVGRVVG